MVIMPKAFSDREKKIIKKKLIGKAKEYFGIFGLKKTNIGDLTKSIGIAKGTFYNFYKSKEELFLDVLEKVEQDHVDFLSKEIINSDKSPKEVFKFFLKYRYNVIETESIIKMLLSSDEMDYLFRMLPETTRINHFIRRKIDNEYMMQFTKKWQEDGLLKKIDPEILVNLYRIFAVISLGKEHVGKSKINETIDLLIDILAEYLIIPSE